MFSKFFNLDAEKQDIILNAATKEFAQKGYRSASTNEIVKEAGISKGLLFHYFNSKKDLYLFLYDHFIEMFLEKIYANIDWDEKDIFIRYRHIAVLKMELFQKYPEIFNFIKMVPTEDAPEVKQDLENRNKEFINSSYSKMFGDIDFSKFKEGIDIQKAIQIIYWTMEGFAYQQQEKVLGLNVDEINLDEVFSQMDEYIEILKASFYKERS
ncbi:TetR/AcrR family transcriptional regulator [Bacillus sp. 165]|nr:TetR/AcrR family transcriptional regulator [Bacillus sp. 165]